MRQFCLLVSAVLCAGVVLAQTPSASVVGRITDASGAVVPGVLVKVTNLDTNQTQTAASNQVGDYTVP